MALPRGIEPLFLGWKPSVLTDRRRERTGWRTRVYWGGFSDARPFLRKISLETRPHRLPRIEQHAHHAIHPPWAFLRGSPGFRQKRFLPRCYRRIWMQLLAIWIHLPPEFQTNSFIRFWRSFQFFRVFINWGLFWVLIQFHFLFIGVVFYGTQYWFICLKN